MSKRSRKHRRPRAELRDAKAALLGEEPKKSTADPWAGVIGERALLYGFAPDGSRIEPPMGWQCDGLPQEIGVRGDGWASGHGGTVGDSIEPDDARLARAADLNAEELAVTRLVAEKRRHYDIAAELGLTLRQVESRVASGNRKLAAYAEAVREMGDR